MSSSRQASGKVAGSRETACTLIRCASGECNSRQSADRVQRVLQNNLQGMKNYALFLVDGAIIASGDSEMFKQQVRIRKSLNYNQR